MASKFVAPQLAMARRQMGSMAIKKVEGLKAHQVETSLLPSGLKVSSLDSDVSAMSTIGVLVKSGSGYESYDNLGVSHALRLGAGNLTTRNATSFGIVRNIQQIGGQINVIGSREYLLYLLTVPRSNVNDSFDYFNEMVTQPSFKPWELSDQITLRMLEEIKNVDMATSAVEALHKAAYRHGLGNSLFSPEYMVSNHNQDMLQAFHAKTHTVTRTAIAGHGIDHGTLSRLGNALSLDKGHGITQPSKYYGGEVREIATGGHTVIAIGGESGPADNVKEALAFTLLKNVLGTGTNIKRGNLNGKLGKAIAKIEGNAAVGGFNFSYRDTGLAGAIITCESGIAGHVATTVLAELRTLQVTDEELQAAKNAFLVETSEASAKPEVLAETLANNVMSGSESASEMINMISASDVNAAAKKLVNGKLSMAAVGNLKNLPYLDTM